MVIQALWIDNGDGKFRNPVLTDEEFTAGLEELKQAAIDCLWRKATAWQEQYISNAAYGLLAIGVMQGKPKSLACMQWINNIWTNHYYVQKPLVTHDYQGYDFSICGPMPYTVPEMTAEVLG